MMTRLHFKAAALLIAGVVCGSCTNDYYHDNMLDSSYIRFGIAQNARGGGNFSISK